mmetsp:Transcript_11051/g.27023  ORF Transcript_11051/g.27023 Transcript_11051/m.27023 type:complete len:266 (+) Transcript_11051:109-906(+)|eukprot:CAMPEP_0179003170 /NCGR_PEP_ID=MMETSP0795-20121207/12497_1 /TAXON_ID=88552 /ORGANISM="Amoebophrya sp., Strain Ameob2" /LENGTH=265 /DNA_ID=CAMNT_0020697085 /DNA_START=66 /DNA_END=863 /DNA_ORIENTATION=-
MRLLFVFVSATAARVQVQDAPGDVGSGPGDAAAGSKTGSYAGTADGAGAIYGAASTSGDASYGEAGSVSAAAARAAGLISSVSASGAGTATTALVDASSSGQAASDPRVRVIQQELIAGAESFDKASSIGETAEQKELKNAIRAALTGSPTVVGAMPAPGSSAGVRSFLRAVGGKLTLTQMAGIASAVASSAAKHVSSGRASSSCDKCIVNWVACPMGWAASADGTCAPPTSYQGYCNKSFSPAEFSPAQLEESEVFCGFCMPCA